MSKLYYFIVIQFIAVAILDFDYLIYFTEDITAEMFQPQSCESLAMKEKLPVYFWLSFLPPYNLDNLRSTKFVIIPRVCIFEYAH